MAGPRDRRGRCGGVCAGARSRALLHPNSPYYGSDPNDPEAVGHARLHQHVVVPGYDYLNFASEDTRIAAPPLHSLKRFFAPEDLWPAGYSPV